MKKHFLFGFFLALVVSCAAQSKVLVLSIKSEIDPRMTRYVQLALEEAEKSKADYLIIDMDTYGGALTDAKEIADMIMKEKKPVWAFINSDAASAGALISIAADSIYMSPGASIGAATVVDGEGKPAPDKYQSYMRSIMRSTAEEHKRNPQIAEGMVDESLEIPGIKQKGKVITFTTAEAIANGYCEGKVNSIDEILKQNKVSDYEIIRFELGSAEKIIALFLNPVVSSILILVFLAGLYFEMQSPGIGFPLAAALAALVLYLTPYYLNGLAENWEIILLFVGFLLLAAEIFVIPGFGVAGILGISFVAVSLILIMLNNDFFNFDFVSSGSMLGAVFAALGGLCGGVLLLLLGSSRLAQSKSMRRIVNADVQLSSEGYSVNANAKLLIGKKGITHTVLRPGGKVIIEEQLYDACSRGEYVEKGEAVEVIGTEGVTIRVKKITAD